MRKSLSFVRCISPLLIASALSLPSPSALQSQSATTQTTQIDYTGSLYGYYRMEFNESDQNHLPPVKSFLDYRKADSSRLLLSMGDNFGPEFGAAIQLENLDTPDPSKGGCNLPQTIDPDTKETRPESLYKDDGRVAPRANCDNVLNFLMHAGFRAVVPGSQDFMYTARWLRVSALLLSDAGQDPVQKEAIGNFDHKTYLLGANLRITLKGGGGTRCPLLFSQNPLDRNTFRCVGDASAPEPEPLDWLGRLDRLARNGGSNPTVSALQMLASESAAQAQGRPIQLSELVLDEISILQSAWGQRFHIPALSSGEKSKQAQAGSQVLTSDQVSDLADKLKAMSDCPAPANTGDQAEMCAYASRLEDILNSMKTILAPSGNNPGAGAAQQTAAGHKGVSASVILTDKERDAAIDGLLRTVAIEEKDIGYTVAQTADGSNVLIVGLTGQNTMNAVSQTNIRLCPGTHKDPANAFGVCGDRQTPGSGAAVATDPVPITEAIVRGAELLAADRNQRPFDKIIVMAQMPRTEAEVLSERVSALLKNDGAHFHIDVVLSEAESGYGTPQLSLSFPASAKRDYPAPVVAPIPSYNSQTGDYPGKVSRLTLDSPADMSFSIVNEPDGIFAPPPVQGSSPTTIALLSQLMAQLGQSSTTLSIAGTDPQSKAEFALLNDLEKASRPNADVVLLQSRDVELDAIGPGYSGYEVCANETEHPDLCKLRVALDRIFWKGDYLEYVAVTGKSLKNMLEVSENQMAQQAQLADTGVTQEWLISYGIVQSTLANVTEINQNNEPLWIPVDPSCLGDSSGKTTYCIGGTPVTDDGYYWLITSDQLAQDKAVYGTLESLPPANHQRTDVYITAPLSHYLFNSLHGASPQVAALAPAAGPAEKVITAQNEVFQQMPLWQIEFAKVIASFTSRAPVGGNANVQQFQGVSDARASAPTQQELDLELANRITGTFFKPGGNAKALASLSIGEQTAFAYDRAVLGNLTGKPINPSYSLNNLTEGAFLQIRLHAMKSDNTVRSVRSLPRSLLVLTPRQYQIEINTPYLFFPFAASAVPAGELTVQLPRASGWTDRAGFRREFGNNRPKSRFSAGSFYETGMEFSQQNGVLSSVTFQDGTTGTPKTCPVQANITLQNCFTAAKFVINNTTTATSVVRTLHTPGLYWNFHFQNRLFGSTPGKQISLVTDSNGDYFFGRSPSAELPTQTEYDIPLSLALVLPSWGNLSFAPTYTGFYYKPQRSGNSLEENSFSIAARWYFARDARVPLRRQIPLQGPASADQTHTGKGH
ncbi:MAG: hypothetical protein ACLP07_07420 [Terracidiphilus sp.]